MHEAAGKGAKIGAVIVAAAVGAVFAFVTTAASEVASRIVVPSWQRWLKKVRKFNKSKEKVSVVIVNGDAAKAATEEALEEEEAAKGEK